MVTEEELQERADDALRTVLQTGLGRRFVWHLIDVMAGTFGGSFAGEALTSAYQEGRRSVGIEVMRACQRVAPGLYVQAMEEAMEERRQLEQERKEAERKRQEEQAG